MIGLRPQRQVASGSGENRFTSENGAGYLRTAFANVELAEFTDSRLVVTDPECVVDEIHRKPVPDRARASLWRHLGGRRRRRT